MTVQERIQAAVDEAYATFVTHKVKNLAGRAKLRYPEADLRSLVLDDERGLDRSAIVGLGRCNFVGCAQNVVIQGPTRTGKSYLACALFKACCERRYRSYYIRMPDLEDALEAAREKPQG